MTTLADDTAADMDDIKIVSTAVPVTTSEPEGPAFLTDADREVEIRQYRPWYSGWCGPGPECLDGKRTNKVGEPIRHCRGEAINGDKAPRKVLPCACACHQEHPTG